MKHLAIGAALVIGLALPSWASVSEVPPPSPVETGYPATAWPDDSRFRLDLVWRAEREDCFAQFTLGRGFENGWYGFRKIRAAAWGWYIKAAKKGHAGAQYKAGLIYERGVGIILQSMSEAYMWFALAASQGIEWGTSRRDEIAKKMTPEQIAEAGKLVEKWEPDPASCEKLALSIPASTSLALAEAEVQRTWDLAQVLVILEQFDVFANGALRSPDTQARLSKIPAGVKLPTIIYLHGCDGIFWHNKFVFKILARNGYALVAPDSLARKYHPVPCRFWNLGIRKEEIHYALEQLRKLPWVDQGNLFLMGHSQGGWVVAAYGGDEFMARIVSGNTCSSGLWGSIPTLVTWSRRDMKLGPTDHCSGAEERVVLAGSEHWVLGWPEVREAVVDFLQAHTTKNE